LNIKKRHKENILNNVGILFANIDYKRNIIDYRSLCYASSLDFCTCRTPCSWLRYSRSCKHLYNNPEYIDRSYKYREEREMLRNDFNMDNFKDLLNKYNFIIYKIWWKDFIFFDTLECIKKIKNLIHL